MDKDIARILQEKMNGAPQEDIFPGLDKQAEWTDLSRRLHKQKVIVFPMPLRYAAAVIAGLVLGCLGTKLFNTQKQIISQTIVVKAPIQQNILPAVEEPHQPPAATPIVKKEPEPTVHKRRIPKTLPLFVAPTTKPKSIVHEEVAVAETAKPAHAETLVATAAPARRMVHILDVLNEDERTVLVPGSNTQQTRGLKRFYFVLSPRNMSTVNSNNASYSLVNSFLTK